jgi:hypothetical protein
MSGRGNRSTRRRPAQVPLSPAQILHDLNKVRNRAAIVGSRRLTAWATARPWNTWNFANLWTFKGISLFFFNSSHYKWRLNEKALCLCNYDAMLVATHRHMTVIWMITDLYTVLNKTHWELKGEGHFACLLLSMLDVAPRTVVIHIYTKAQTV